jgi:formylglycine-generating enzyme required for sulfatase activity
MPRFWSIVAIGGGGALACLVGLALFRLSTTAPPASYGADREAEVFKDCEDCPEMLRIEPGTFSMGSESKILYRNLDYDSQPVRVVTIEYPFAIGRHEVTFNEWDACVSAGACNGYLPPDEGWGRGDLPVIHVSWRDASAYVTWLSETTGKTYRLPSEAEWEYVARGGVRHAFSWGRWPSHDFANYGKNKCCTGEVKGSDKWLNTSPVGSFPANAFGVYDMSGNVYEWVQDCFADSYTDASFDGSPYLGGDCDRRRIRGGAWYSDPGRIRSSYRAYQSPEQRDYVIGFRVVREVSAAE